jgi:TatD DNase family protein
MLIDTHCHLDGTNCKEGADAALVRARSAGVGAFVAIGVGSLVAAREVLALSERHADVSCTVGVHPHDATTLDDELYTELAALAANPLVVAIGEIGLDYHYDHSPRDAQAEAFRRFIALARKVQKPIVVHTRSAAADTLSVLETEGASDVGGVIHCFCEDRAFARRAFDLGFDVSFSGIVTFKNATSIHDVASFAPDERFLVETDSPYLAPVPKRGKPNEPAYIVHTARRIAELRGTTFEHIQQITTENALRRFGPMLDAGSRSGQS